eukprot:CAMPEP_0115047424 /NCGR_PEP_ID=MMETSP0216-20121206/49292_1 /TAXON_ID=223996 /ORGANISM="Protocruzia adherens, Strain Boccale" /LENGTH=732 /DNA_ID=CAMNT_0002430605 /DNA_START=30 /DNA_END=2228 /DNA_ORIENTATION=-
MSRKRLTKQTLPEPYNITLRKTQDGFELCEDEEQNFTQTSQVSIDPRYMEQKRKGRKGEIFPYAPSNVSNMSYTNSMPIIEKDGASVTPKGTGASNGNKSMEVKSGTVIVPSCSAWFSIDSIHEIERESLPEFFCKQYPSKTPEIYKEYRNFMISLYRENPKQYLSATTCRRTLAGDVCAILRVHSLLEHWGLINFNVDPASRPIPAIPRNNTYNQIFVNAADSFDKQKKYNELSHIIRNDATVHQINYISKTYRPNCDYCGSLCGVVWYRQMLPDGIELAQDQKLLTLCLKCYSEENFPMILSSSDFEKQDILTYMEQKQKPDAVVGSEWTEDETVKLLNAIDKYGENWEKVVEQLDHKKSREDCITHFLQLPIKEITNYKVAEDKTFQDNLHAFGDFSNPILGQVGVLGKLLKEIKAVEPVEEKTAVDTNAEASIKEVSSVPNDIKPIESTNTTEEEVKTQEITANIKEEDSTNKEAGESMDVDQKGYTDIVLEDNQNDANKSEGSSSEKAPFMEKTGLTKEEISQVEENVKSRAQKLVEMEDHEIDKLVNRLIDAQMSKLSHKLQYFDEFEKLLQYEKSQIEMQQQQIVAERVRLADRKLKLARLEVQLREKAATATGEKESSTSLTTSSGVTVTKDATKEEESVGKDSVQETEKTDADVDVRGVTNSPSNDDSDLKKDSSGGEDGGDDSDIRLSVFLTESEDDSRNDLSDDNKEETIKDSNGDQEMEE